MFSPLFISKIKMNYGWQGTVISVVSLISFIPSQATYDRNNIINFVYDYVPQLENQTSGYQYAALFLMSDSQVHDGYPSPFGSVPEVNANLNFTPSIPVEYVVARPFRVGETRGKQRHAEEFCLEQLPDMYQRYQSNHEETPSMILLFTRYFPCTAKSGKRSRDCAATIRRHLSDAQYGSVRYKAIVVNADDDQLKVLDIQSQINMFECDNISVVNVSMRHCFSRNKGVNTSQGSRSDPCLASHLMYYQNCLVTCLENGTYPSVGADAIDTHLANMINILLERCHCNSSKDICFNNTMMEILGDAHGNQWKLEFVERMLSCDRTCNVYPKSQPSQDFKVVDNSTLLISFDQLNNYENLTSFECTSDSYTGLFCSFCLVFDGTVTNFTWCTET